MGGKEGGRERGRERGWEEKLCKVLDKGPDYKGQVYFSMLVPSMHLYSSP